MLVEHAIEHLVSSLGVGLVMDGGCIRATLELTGELILARS